MTRHSSIVLLFAVRSSRTACCRSPGGELLHLLNREKLQELHRGYTDSTKGCCSLFLPNLSQLCAKAGLLSTIRVRMTTESWTPPRPVCWNDCASRMNRRHGGRVQGGGPAAQAAGGAKGDEARAGRERNGPQAILARGPGDGRRQRRPHRHDLPGWPGPRGPVPG